MSTVRSVEPVSTTTISSKRPSADARQSGRLSSSLRTIIVRLTLHRRLAGLCESAGLACIVAARVRFLGPS